MRILAISTILFSPLIMAVAAGELPTTVAGEWLLRELAAPEIPDTMHHELALHGLFTDGMVLQRDRPVPIWGWGPEGADIAVSFGDVRATGKVSGHRWSVTLPALPASSQERELTVSCGSRGIVLKNVLVGDVWLCTGQSNMQVEMKIDTAAYPPRAADLDAANNPLVRFYKVDRASSRRPRSDVPTVHDDIYEPWSNAFLGNQWRPCTKEWAQHVSATAFYFARDIQPRIGCPLGVLVCARGATSIWHWVPGDVVRQEACWTDCRQLLDDVESSWPQRVTPLAAEWRTFTDTYPTLRALWLAQQVPGTPPIRAPQQLSWPTCFYNGMLHPMAPFAVRGVLWYQGEGDVGNAVPYADKMVSLIACWRRLWQRPDLPFIITQLAGFDGYGKGDAAALRAAQARVPGLIPNAYMATVFDAGMRENIHPYRKDVTGQRLALVAGKEVYGLDIAAYGPVCQSVTRENASLVVSFGHAEKGLIAKQVNLDGSPLPAGVLEGFAMCGSDREFVKATAVINGDQVVVSSPEVTHPVAVRYAWANFPVANLYNGDDLPAAPFEANALQP